MVGNVHFWAINGLERNTIPNVVDVQQLKACLERGDDMKKHKKQRHSNVMPAKKKTGESNIRQVSAVNCTKGMMITLDECKACEHHSNMFCKLVDKEHKIGVIPLMHPMLFNRNMFQQSSDAIREDSINYYFKTDILNAVNNITDYPNYTKCKYKYIRGAYTVREADPDRKIAPFDQFSVILFLVETDSITNSDIMVDGKKYMITKPFDHKGDWQILMYLYNTYSLDGFADYKIMGIGYKVLLKPVPNFPVDFIIARNDDKLIVGRINK